MQGKFDQAMDAYKASLRLLEKLAAEMPEVHSVEHELAFALLNVGQTLDELKRPDEALEYLDRGIARLRVIEKVSKEYADTLKEAVAIRADVAKKRARARWWWPSR
jgi:tetratricopeptide (TPR) repeat protein